MSTAPLRLRIDGETELKILEERDAPEVFALVDKNRAHLRQWLPWVDVTQTIEDELTFIRTVSEQHADQRGFSCGIWYRGRLAGTIGYHVINWSNRKVEIGYWLGAEYQGKGLMTRACQRLISYAFDDLRLNKVEIRCATGNTRSCAIPQRLGFTQEGVIRQAEWLYDHYADLVLYGLLESEWREHNRR